MGHRKSCIYEPEPKGSLLPDEAELMSTSATISGTRLHQKGTAPWRRLAAVKAVRRQGRGALAPNTERVMVHTGLLMWKI